MTTNSLARQRECYLGRVLRERPQVGEMLFVRALLLEQSRLATEELGDTTDFSQGVLFRARQKAGMGSPPLVRETILTEGLEDCLHARYLGLCAVGRCVGGDFISIEINRLSECTQANE